MNDLVNRIRAWTRSRAPEHGAVAEVVVTAQPSVVRRTNHLDGGAKERSVFLDVEANGIGIDLTVPDPEALASELAASLVFLRGEDD